MPRNASRASADRRNAVAAMTPYGDETIQRTGAARHVATTQTRTLLIDYSTLDRLLAHELRQDRITLTRILQNAEAGPNITVDDIREVVKEVFRSVLTTAPSEKTRAVVSNQSPPLTTNSEQRASPSAPASTYGRTRMKKDRTMTVIDLWQEWTVGIDGGPAIRDLEASTNKKWRTSSKTESKYFQRRFTIIDAIQKSIAGGLNEREAVARIEQQRAGRSLNLFSEELRKARGEVTSEEGSI